MNKGTEMVLGALGGAIASVLLEAVIAEAKLVLAFKYVSKELASTMEDLLPIIKQIESIEKGEDELKKLMVTIERARELVLECLGVKWWDPVRKARYTRKIEKINKEMLKFCQFQLQLIMHKNQMGSMVEREAIKGQVEIIEKKLDRLSVPSPPRVFRDRCSVPKVDKVFVGLNWPLMEVKKKLLDDAVDSLVVSAPPGCGKTTLVTQLCHRKDIKKKFKHIFFNVVSSAPNFRVIVQNLLEHNGYDPCTFDDESQATVAFRNLMEELKEDGDILLVLDDVWLGAEDLLQLFRINLPGYKILVTSRFEFQCFGSPYNLKPLGDKYARDLLIQWASPPDHTSPDEYEDLLRKILKRCDGSPLVIEVVGVSLKGKDLYLWKGQVESWSQEETLLGKPTVLHRLQPSFNALNQYLKECFLDMGSFLEDQKIRASVIIDIWVELYGKGSGSMYMKYLDDLASQNLLKLVPLGRNEHKDGFYNELLVTQHDILRELAIFQTKSEENHEIKRKRLNLEIRDNIFPDWCLDLTQPIKARLLSISTDDLFSSSSWVEMDCPNVEALVLNLSSSKYALPNFIATMKKLKVLIIINHGAGPAKLTNLSCLGSLPNLKRMRLEKVSITLLEIPQLQLNRLRKLSLVMCSFGYDKGEIDVSKALLSLQEIDIDYCYDLEELPCWVFEVVSLKTLNITNCYKLSLLPEALGNLSNLEVLRLCSCNSLSELPETMERLGKLRFLDISHCLELKKLPLEIGKLGKLKKISMSKCSGCDLPDSISYLEDLQVKCDKETAFLWEWLKPKMRNLGVLEEEVEYNLNLLQLS